ncbi:MAG: hypothetical protein AAGA02_05525 [Bacteroidota bacterium]
MEKEKTKIVHDEMPSSCTICNAGNIKFYLKDKGIRVFISNACRTPFMDFQYSDRYFSDFIHNISSGISNITGMVMIKYHTLPGMKII